jgi:hypothetical protein
LKGNFDIIQNFGVIAPKGGGWSNFIKVLRSYNPQQYGFDLPDCIQAYEREIIETIQTEENPEVLIIKCSEVGADDVVQKAALNDNLIRSLIDRSRDATNDRWGSATHALIAIEKIRKDGKLISSIVEAFRIHQREEYLAVKLLSLVTQDDQVMNLLIDLLGTPFLVYLPRSTFETLYSIANEMTVTESGALKLPDRWVPGSAMGAAEVLLATGDKRLIRKIVQHLFEFIASDGFDRNTLNGPMKEWCYRYKKELRPHLMEGLNHENNKVRVFAVNYLFSKIGDSECMEAINKMKNDPDPEVREAVKYALKH